MTLSSLTREVGLDERISNVDLQLFSVHEQSRCERHAPHAADHRKNLQQINKSINYIDENILVFAKKVAPDRRCFLVGV